MLRPLLLGTGLGQNSGFDFKMNNLDTTKADTVIINLGAAYLQSDLPRLLVTVGAALLTILIPLAVAIYSSKREFDILDRNVILDHIVGAKRFLVIFLLIFGPPLLIPVLPIPFSVCALIVFLIGCSLMVGVIGRSYKWIKADKNILRYNYLLNLKKAVDLKESWYSLWQNEKIEFGAELKYSGLFCSTLSRFSEKEEFECFPQFAAMYSDYSLFIRSRNPMIFISGPVLLREFLKWHYKISQKEKDLRGNSPEPTGDIDLHKWAEYYEFLGAFNRSLIDIYNILINNRASLNLYRVLEDHASSQIDKLEYISGLLGGFYECFLENFHIFQHKEEALRTFPQKWRITKNNLKAESTGIYTRELWQGFARWAIDRIGRATDKTDEEMEAIVREFFPDVDPILWSRLLIFSLTPPYSENRVKLFVERPWNFGLFGRIRSFVGDISQSSFAIEEEAGTHSTIELAFALFKNDYNSESLKKYLSELECFNYDDNDRLLQRKIYLIGIFNKMRQIMQEKSQDSKGS
jgi:hypothetical protein